MIRYFCKKCNITSEHSECPHCGNRADLEESAVFWCDDCNIPIFEDICPICGAKGRKIGSDIRPVFPEERLLIEVLLGEPLKYKNSSVWNTSGNYYYADGKKLPLSPGKVKNIDPLWVREQLETYSIQNQYTAFEAIIKRFVGANKARFESIVAEAADYIRNIAQHYGPTEMYVSFFAVIVIPSRNDISFIDTLYHTCGCVVK